MTTEDFGKIFFLEAWRFYLARSFQVCLWQWFEMWMKNGVCGFASDELEKFQGFDADLISAARQQKRRTRRQHHGAAIFFSRKRRRQTVSNCI